jgi:hypothetical protein
MFLTHKFFCLGPYLAKTSFEIMGPTKTFLVFFDSAEEKLSWWNDLKTCIENALQKHEGIILLHKSNQQKAVNIIDSYF